MLNLVTLVLRFMNSGLINSLQKQPLDVFYKKTVPKNFAIFTGRSLFLIKLQALRPATILKRDFSTDVFL